MGGLLALGSIMSMITLTPFFVFLFSIVFMASIGKSFGVRRLYVNLLVKIFEFGRQNIESVRQQQYANITKSVAEVEQARAASESGNQTTESNDIGDGSETKVNGSIPNGNSTTGGQHRLSNGGDASYIVNGGNTVISRAESLILSPEVIDDTRSKSTEPHEEDGGTVGEEGTDGEDGAGTDGGSEGGEHEAAGFKLANCLDYVKSGMEAIIEDEVTSRFLAEELKNWNLLTRTNRHYEFISWRLTVIWMIGFLIRYFILMPMRVLICFIGVVYCVIGFAFVGMIPTYRLRRAMNDVVFKHTFRMITRSISGVVRFHHPEYKPKNCGFCVANHTTPIDIAILSTDCTYSLVMWLTFCTAVVGCIPEGSFKRTMVRSVLIQCFGFLSSALSSVVNYHNIENRPLNGICVANHTSPIDVLMLMCDNCYSLIGQRHGGFLGVLQRALARASPHIWFERAEAKDRLFVAKRLKEHVSDPVNPPILIFPEGTCINNTSVMQFKKGSFEVGGVIYPVAIKYDPRFGDAFWNSSRYSMMQYLFLMMTSWAIVCDVWYLPPMYRGEGESAIDFANRVKSVIAKQGGLVDLVWDGQLKRMKPKKEWKEKQQEKFSKLLKGE
ncbi:glycerol-3-phosphate acyltransferase 3 [Anopheles ziemanni]|uniref:glycerol-3-phosphate acyltransferase 3 n=1 Tax=Anopheles ziemanni TaxID=345580 RepID=UPI00265AD717|nr:glycerol-3-phosphate acyltransferase 3 isoform X1 [Anopheles coustani]XP_058175133.1 glycerol-3-phosphate acyltransferase 3 [Anopheles ziemanni]